jgi:hypothetical protein
VKIYRKARAKLLIERVQLEQNKYLEDMNMNITLQKQFAAVTYLIDEETAYIAYRGNDATVMGWKEDFNMAFITAFIDSDFNEDWHLRIF